MNGLGRNEQRIVTRFDGRPAPTWGRKQARDAPLPSSGNLPTRYPWTFALDGKPFAQGLNTLAADRRSFIETAWRVSDPGKTITLVYDRQ